MESNKTTVHCVKVPRVYDWVNKSTVIKLKETFQLEQKQFDDFLCCDFSIPSRQLERTILWTTYGINQIGGSICINFKSGYGNILSVFVNGEKQAEVHEGSSFSATFTQLESVAVQCDGKNVNADSCNGEFKIMFHYLPNEDSKLHSTNDIKKAICFVSDCHGNPISSNYGCSITCKELTCSENRECVHVTDECGETIFLHRVDLLVEGYICVQLLNCNGDICCQCVFPFSEVETVILCAPPGTTITCRVNDVDCRAHILPAPQNKSDCLEIVIMLTICQSIHSVNEVVVELKGTLCQPRLSTAYQSAVQVNAPPNGLSFFT